MNFLVVLVCLTANYLWLKDFDRFDDAWFFKFRCKVENRDQSNESSATPWFFNLLIIYLFPLSVLVAALLLVADLAFGILTLILHCAVLLAALDRTQPGKLTREFTEVWLKEGLVSARKYIGSEFESEDIDAIKDNASLARHFSKVMIHRSFERMFVMFFWYMLAGPVAVAFSYISYQLKDSHGENQAEPLVKTVDVFIWVLEWAPMRLLALTFSLAGNFVHCFETVKQSFWDVSLDVNNAELLYNYSQCALIGMADSLDLENSDAPEEESPIAKEVFKLKALQALLERSQAIWLVTLGLITIFAL